MTVRKRAYQSPHTGESRHWLSLDLCAKKTLGSRNITDSAMIAAIETEILVLEESPVVEENVRGKYGRTDSDIQRGRREQMVLMTTTTNLKPHDVEHPNFHLVVSWEALDICGPDAIDSTCDASDRAGWVVVFRVYQILKFRDRMTMTVCTEIQHVLLRSSLQEASLESVFALLLKCEILHSAVVFEIQGVFVSDEATCKRTAKVSAEK
jgi:hypothetical protein